MDNLDWILSSVIIIIFAATTMYFLADVHLCNRSKKKRIVCGIYFAGYLIFNIFFQVVHGLEIYGDFYFLITQIPLYILLSMLSRYRGIKMLFLYTKEIK